jgi:hypothetical protein
MLKPLGDHTQSEGLHLCESFPAVLTVAEHARKARHLGQPAAIGFGFELYGEGHGSIVPLGRLPNKHPTAAGGS